MAIQSGREEQENAQKFSQNEAGAKNTMKKLFEAV
jgi:hypothetical protein